MINKKICEEILDGSLTAYKNFAAGFYKAYYITIDYKAPIYIVYIHATYDNDAGKAMFESFLKQHRDSMQYLSKVETKDHTVKLRIVRPNKKKLIASVLDETINPVISQLLACKYVTGCINCGVDDIELDCYAISGYHHYLCEQCIEEIEEDFKIKQKNWNEKPVNHIAGTIGALVFSLVGIILWAILQSNGLYGWLAGIVTIFISFKGYEMFGGRLDKKGFITSLIISGIVIILSNHIAWAWTLSDIGLKAGYSYKDIFLSKKLFSLIGYTFKYFESLILGFAVSFALGYKMIKSKYRTSIGGYSIKKIQ